MSDTNLDIVIADDSKMHRLILEKCISKVPNARLVGQAENGHEALALLEAHDPDLLILDLMMPTMDGIETIRTLTKKKSRTGVIIVSGVNFSDAESTLHALEMGAFDFIVKRRNGDADLDLTEAIPRSIEAFRQSRSILPPVFYNLPTALEPTGPKEKPEAVVIATSTGGPNALAEVIPHLPADLGVPVYIVQHMPTGFTDHLSRSLNKKSKLTVHEAQEGQSVGPNEVFLAPGGQHMLCEGTASEPVIALNEDARVHSCRPAADLLFNSAVKLYGPRTLAVVMTGMGQDGRDGVREIRREGGYCIVQDPESCVVYGMPGSVVDDGGADEIVPLDKLAKRIAELVKFSAGSRRISA